MEAARRMKEVLGAPDEVTEVLKALISSGGDNPCLIDASTGNEVGVSVLKGKYVLLLITGPKICGGNVYKMRSIYDGIARKDLLEMVWLPSTKRDYKMREFTMRKYRFKDELKKLRSQMPQCVLRYFSAVKGIHKIIEACGLMSGEIVVLIDPLGDVLSQCRCLPRLWPILLPEKMDTWKRIKKHLQAPDEITAVLKALISAGDDMLCLSDASTHKMGRPANKRVSIDVLRDKYVLLFISDLNIDSSVIRKMWSIYSGIVNKHLVKLVWIPIVEKWTNELGEEFEKLQSEMQRCILQPVKDVPIVLMMKPSYIEQDVSQAEGLKFIKEWGLQDVPLVLLMNPHGDVLSNHALQLPRIVKEPRGAPDMKEYTLYWGSKYAYWRERLFRAVIAMAQDPIMNKAEISISVYPVGRDREPEGVPSSFNWKVQRLFYPFKSGSNWALLVSKSFTEICAGPLILNVLEAFHIWKVNITEERPFEFCFKGYFDELSRGFVTFADDEKESDDSVDNEIKISDFSDDEMEFEDSVDNEIKISDFSDDEVEFEDSVDNEIKISDFSDDETESEDSLDNKNQEKMAARRMKEVLGALDEVTEVLKALISTSGDVPCLVDASTEEMKQVSIDVLKDKYVLLLASRVMGKDTKYLQRGLDFARGIVKNDLLEIVWLPIVSWNDEAEDEVMGWLSKMPRFIVQYFSPIAGIEFIKQEWGLEDYPTFVMMNPQGDVLGKYTPREGLGIFPIRLGVEIEIARTVKEHFQAPDEITAALKALISGNPLLKECSTGEMVSIDVLKEKFVLWFISSRYILEGGFYGDPRTYGILSSIYDGILKDLVKLVWIPIAEKSHKLRTRFKMLPYKMPHYVVQCVSPGAGLKFIEKWRLSDRNLVVLISPQGNVLSKHEIVSLIIQHSGPHEIRDYTFYWRARDKKWGKLFSELVDKVLRDPIVTGKNTSIECHRFRSSTPNRFLRKSFNRDRSNWAVFAGRSGFPICEGPQILHVLQAFETWKDDLRSHPFGYCFEKRYKELANIERSVTPRIFVGDVGLR